MINKFKKLRSLSLGRFYSFLFIVSFSSCHDLHQKMYDAFHEKKSALVKDSTIKKDSVISSSLIQLTPEEEKDSVTNGSTPTPWENAGIIDVKGLKFFIRKLQLWSEQNNKDSIAANIEYPLLNDEKISSATIFLQQYDKVFNGKIKQALKEQKLNNLFRNFQGVMIGSGELWIANVSKTKREVYKIRSINYDE